MPQRRIHRKLIRHVNDAGHVRELTFSCFQRQPLLGTDSRRQLLSEAIERAVEKHQFGLAAFVFMPEHVHLIVFPKQNASDIAALLNAIKRPFSFRVKQ